MSVLSGRVLWVAVIVIAVCDILTTLYGLQAGLVESNPIAFAAIGISGVAGIVILKLWAVGVGFALYEFIPMYERIVPTILATVWAVAVLNNTYLLILIS